MHEGRVSKYLLYAIGEILLVMIGILLAFQVDNWNETRKKRTQELKYYTNLKDDLHEYKAGINGQNSYNRFHLDAFAHALAVSVKGDLSEKDTLVAVVPFLFNYSDFDREGNIYETLVNSGDAKLLSNEKIIQGMRELEYRFQYINRMENIHWDVILDYVSSWASTNIKFVSLEADNPQVLFSFEFQNLLILLQRIMEEKENVYQETVTKIELLIEDLEKEIAKGR